MHAIKILFITPHPELSDVLLQPLQDDNIIFNVVYSLKNGEKFDVGIVDEKEIQCSKKIKELNYEHPDRSVYLYNGSMPKEFFEEIKYTNNLQKTKKRISEKLQKLESRNTELRVYFGLAV